MYRSRQDQRRRASKVALAVFEQQRYDGGRGGQNGKSHGNYQRAGPLGRAGLGIEAHGVTDAQAPEPGAFPGIKLMRGDEVESGE
ncbi:hypothetical protein N7462_004708 [Penicillium macrosclerotiorum]|uniref:uncharacterized protein n=1 Tax=Penicillium macrosclerotiorum TaxID=303699 RepID=UPI002546B7D3|nr:uncharacterized protein N7462_004708 [Penicillium macrosclerotiorum]KAJ5690316.1 hypothetical protein N7462_004708 [Penicillium macrosclerotiorum]